MEQKIIDIIRRNLEDDREVTLQSRLKEDLGADSFSMLMVLNEIEDVFRIRIEGDGFEGLETVADVCRRLKEMYPELEAA